MGGEAAVSTQPLSLTWTPATRGQVLAPELCTRGSRAEPPVLGPGALGVTVKSLVPDLRPCQHQPPAAGSLVWHLWEPGLCAVNSASLCGRHMGCPTHSCLGAQRPGIGARAPEGLHRAAQCDLGTATPASCLRRVQSPAECSWDAGGHGPWPLKAGTHEPARRSRRSPAGDRE